MPNINEQNNLILEEIPEELKLTDFEQQLITRSLLFIKVKKLPRNQMRAMKDQVINVPLDDTDIVRNVSTLPRHPDQAHRVAVQLKRKIELKTTHIEGFIRPNIIINPIPPIRGSWRLPAH